MTSLPPTIGKTGLLKIGNQFANLWRQTLTMGINSLLQVTLVDSPGFLRTCQDTVADVGSRSLLFRISHQAKAAMPLA